MSPAPGLLSEWHWQAGAGSLSVALSYRSPDGSTSPAAVRSIVAVSDRPVVHLAPIDSQPNSTAADLSWTETDGIGPGIVGRQIRRDQAPATTPGCGTWAQGQFAAISTAELKSVGAGSVRVLHLSDLSLGRCYRFTLSVTDALGLAGQDSTPAYVPGLLDADGWPLPAWTGTLDTFRAPAFATQKTSTWCVAASIQMMVNLIRGTSDTSADGQWTYLNYANRNDMLPDAHNGAGVIGWQLALDKFSGTPYEVETIGSLQEAVNLAALRLRLTGRPVGLAVKATTHAWVMTGFEATADPAFDPTFAVTAVYVSGPLYPYPEARGYDPAPDTRLAVSDLGKYFTPVYWKTGMVWEFVAPLA
ncbi:MAG TPA: hypothetical protein VF337_11860 [Candidatus Limnocylindrales bacterium]